MAVVGVDACKDGWVGVRLDGDTAPRALCARTVEELVARAAPVAVVGVDIPIGLPVSAPRVADVMARRTVGPRASSVFATPPRAVLQARTHSEASALCRELCGFGVSRQAFALGPRILEVDQWIGRAGVRVVEVHPEVSFAILAGRPLSDPKTTWAGFARRRHLLAAAGIVLDGDLGLAGRRVAPHDVLDAAAAAWSARRVARGEHVCLPDPPEVLPGGGLAATWA